MFFINNPGLRKLEAFMQEVPNFPSKGGKTILRKHQNLMRLIKDLYRALLSFFQKNRNSMIFCWDCLNNMRIFIVMISVCCDTHYHREMIYEKKGKHYYDKSN